MNKKSKTYLIPFVIFIISLVLFSFKMPISNQNQELNDKNLNLRVSGMDYSNATVISDGIQDIIWNDGVSRYPDIALDHLGNVHVVWADDTDGIWGTDYEIMYASYTASSGWSFATVISDGYDDIYWNNDWSVNPVIAIDSSNNIHVVWADETNGIWGTDTEIMHVSYSSSTGWSNVTVISDGYNNNYWNSDDSLQPAITIDNNDNIHVVWCDNTNGIWGSDWEIMYASYSASTGWSNATVISDGYNDIYWNDDSSTHPSIASDNTGDIHVVWQDNSIGVWGIDAEIMYARYSTSLGWSNATVISDGHNNIYWNDGHSVDPDIAIDSSNNVHVVWSDNTDGAWGSDEEIMYTSYILDWAIPIVISDGYDDIFWNNGESISPSITINPNNIIYVAWEDDTLGAWGGGDSIDEEIMCVNYTVGDGWSDVTIISDGAGGIYWNDHISREVSIVAGTNIVHAVWQDNTNGIWGIDEEIMYTTISIPIVPGGKGIPFGNVYLLITLVSTVALVILVKKKNKF